MSKTLLAEARDIVLLMSMLMVLSMASLAVACGAVLIADGQTQHVAALAMAAPVNSLDR